jgi:hypothetical protein
MLLAAIDCVLYETSFDMNVFQSRNLQYEKAE